MEEENPTSCNHKNRFPEPLWHQSFILDEIMGAISAGMQLLELWGTPSIPSSSYFRGVEK
jgi:hypothetical protein